MRLLTATRQESVSCIKHAVLWYVILAVPCFSLDANAAGQDFEW